MRQAQQEASHTCQAPQHSAALSQMPFAFQHLASGKLAPAAEQLTPVLPDKQRLIPAQGTPADVSAISEGRQQGLFTSAGLPARSQVMTSAAEGLHSMAQAAQHTRPVLMQMMQMSQLPLTPPAALHRRMQEAPKLLKALSDQGWGEEQPVARGKSGGDSKHSRSSSEDQRGSRVGADLPTPLLRSATAPPQLLLESQRGSNSPKKPVPKCTAQPGATQRAATSFTYCQGLCLLPKSKSYLSQFAGLSDCAQSPYRKPQAPCLAEAACPC